MHLWLIFSLLLGPWACAAGTYGLRYEVSLDGTNWNTELSAPPGALVYFRMSAYFGPDVTVMSADGLGTAVAVGRFTGSQQMVGFAGGDLFQNLVRVAPTGNPALTSISGSGVIGTTAVTSFASQILLSLDGFLEVPQYTFYILRGELKLSSTLQPRSLTISNKTFGSGNTPGLTFYHSGSPINRQTAKPEDTNTRVDINATINLATGGCPGPGYESFTGSTIAQPSVPAVFTVGAALGIGYEWYHNGVLLTDATRYSGLGSNTLTVLLPMPSDAGSYRCRVHSACFSYSTTFPIGLAIACGADLTRDALVDDQDFLLFVSAYDDFVCPAACPADLNVDGFVDDLDFTSFAFQYDALECP